MTDYDGEDLLKEKQKHSFPETKKNKLSRVLCSFAVANFGPHPSREQKMDLAKAAIELFPALYYVDSQIDGVVRILHFVFRTDCLLFSNGNNGIIWTPLSGLVVQFS